MPTVRAYLGNKRMATGKEWKGKFLQVYPSKKEFASQTEWYEAWRKTLSDSIHFEVEKVPTVAPVPTTPLRSETSNPISTAGWTYTPQLTYTAPPGRYYIGDLCYALHDDIYDRVFGGECYERGLYSKGSSFFLVDGTAYGDGQYMGTDGYPYAVDAGIIGICSADLIDSKNTSICGGMIHSFDAPVNMTFNNGIFRFQSGSSTLIIDTRGTEESDY